MPRYLFLFLIIVICISFVGCPKPVEYMPPDGVWYCEELEIQLSFEPNAESYAMVNGVKVACSVGNDPGTKSFWVTCIESVLDMSPGYVLWEAEYVHRDEYEFVVKEQHTGRIYTFTKLSNFHTGTRGRFGTRGRDKGTVLLSPSNPQSLTP